MIPVIRVNGTDETAFLKKLRARASSVNDEVTASVTEIIRNVRDQGDEAVRAYTLRFDGQAPACFEVDREEINDALTNADPEYVNALLNAVANITDFHTRQKQQSFIDAKQNGSIPAIGRQRLRIGGTSWGYVAFLPATGIRGRPFGTDLYGIGRLRCICCTHVLDQYVGPCIRQR